MRLQRLALVTLASLALVAVAAPARAQESLEDVLRSSGKKRPRVAPAAAPKAVEEPAPPPAPEIPYRTKTAWARTGLTAEVEALVELGGNLLAVSEGAVLVSKDGGATWAKSPGLPTAVDSLVRHGGGVVAAGKEAVMYRSANGEGGWTALPRLPGGKACTFGAPRATESALVAWAICPEPEGEHGYRLVGGKWAPLKLREGALLVGGAASFYTVEEDGSVSTSADAATWKRLAARPCADASFASGEGQRVVVVCSGGGDTPYGLATSSDHGATFSTFSTPDTVYGAFLTGGGTYATMADGLYSTTDGGASWMNVAPDPDNFAVFGNVRDVVELGGVLYAGGLRGVAKVALPR